MGRKRRAGVTGNGQEQALKGVLKVEDTYKTMIFNFPC